MTFLLMDTATERPVAGLYRGQQVIWRANLPEGLQSSQFLLSQIQEGLAACQMGIADLTGIGVGAGPGSYTGIRAAVVAAKVFSWSKRIPLVGLCTLECFELEAGMVSLIDARIGGAYLYGEGKGLPAQLLSLELAVTTLKEYPKLVTPRLEPIKGKIEGLAGNAWEWHEETPSLAKMGKLTDKAIQEGNFTTDGSVEILYLRKTQAELNLRGRAP